MIMSDPSFATDFNECLDPSSCPNEQCENIPGSYECLPCQPGYQAQGGVCYGEHTHTHTHTHTQQHQHNTNNTKTDTHTQTQRHRHTDRQTHTLTHTDTQTLIPNEHFLGGISI